MMVGCYDMIYETSQQQHLQLIHVQVITKDPGNLQCEIPHVGGLLRTPTHSPSDLSFDMTYSATADQSTAVLSPLHSSHNLPVWLQKERKKDEKNTTKALRYGENSWCKWLFVHRIDPVLGIGIDPITLADTEYSPVPLASADTLSLSLFMFIYIFKV